MWASSGCKNNDNFTSAIKTRQFIEMNIAFRRFGHLLLFFSTNASYYFYNYFFFTIIKTKYFEHVIPSKRTYSKKVLMFDRTRCELHTREQRYHCRFRWSNSRLIACCIHTFIKLPKCLLIIYRFSVPT